jgi:hypothetical protein
MNEVKEQSENGFPFADGYSNVFANEYHPRTGWNRAALGPGE